MWKGIRKIIGLVSVAFVGLSSQSVLAQTDSNARPVWEFKLSQELRGRLYDVVVVPGESRVIATTPTAILSIGEGGRVEPLLRLRTGAEEGESALLSADGSHAGVLVHRRHAISGFRLVDLRGGTLASIEAPHQFHYRLSPDVSTFVGIDAGGHHAQAKAKRFVYRFYDRSGNLVSELQSGEPQQHDSAYTPDGAAFVLNNATGLAAFQVADGTPLWRAEMPTRLFAAASSQSQIVVASGAEERNLLQGFRGGESLWRYRLMGSVRNVAISPNGAFMLASDGNTAHLLSPQSDMPLWSRAMPVDALAINSIAVTNQGVVALGAQHSDLTRGLALVLDSNGNVLFEREFAHNLSNAWIPTVQFGPRGRFLSVRTLEELLLLAIN